MNIILCGKITMFRSRTTAVDLRGTTRWTPAEHRTTPRLVEGIEKIRRESKRITLQETLDKLDPKAVDQKRLLERLFEKHLTSGEAIAFFTRLGQDRDVMGRINKRFRILGYEEDAVLKIPFYANIRKPTDWWVIALNPKIFDVPEKIKLEPGVDVKFPDIAPPRFRKIWHYVAERRFCNIEELKEEFGRENVIRFRSQCNKKYIHPMLALTLPTPLLRTNGEPAVYWANKRFARTYGIKIPEVIRRMELDELFSENDTKLLCKIAEYLAVTLADLAEGRDSTNVQHQITKINKRCRELGLPEAITQNGKRRTTKLYCLDKKFSSLFEFTDEKRVSIDATFTNKQAAAIKFIVENPLCNNEQLANAIGTTREQVREILQRINEICKRKRWPLIIREKTDGMLYYVPEELAKKLGLKHFAIEKRSLFTTPDQKRMFDYLEDKPRETKTRDIAKALGINMQVAVHLRIRMNRRLARFGFSAV